MFKITRKSRLVKVAAATAAIGSLAAIGFVGNSPANADPKQYDAPLFGFGSDTLQDVTNAFAGANVGTTYIPPLQTSALTGQKQIVSWDAFAPGAADPSLPNCINPRVGSPQILRPNGSSNGVRALSAAYNTAQRWPSGNFTVAQACGVPRSMSNIVTFARSSASVGTLSGPLVYIPFGRDAFGFGYVKPSAGVAGGTAVGQQAPVISITDTQLTALHATGPQLIDPDGTGPLLAVPVIACGIQTGSGTYSSWMGALILATNGTGDPGTNTCNNAGTVPFAGRVQENNGPDLTGKSTFLSAMTSDICDGVAGGAPVTCEDAQLVVGFSASQFIARSNGIGTPNPNLGLNGGLGAINGIPATLGTAPNLTPNGAWYANTIFGRDVTFVVAAVAIEGQDASPSIIDMFVGPSSKVCSATTTIQQHGFLSLGAACGATVQRGPFRT